MSFGRYWAVLPWMLLAIPARADDFFSWIDDDGSVHYTDDESQVPASKRRKARVTKGADIGEVSKSHVTLELPDPALPKESKGADPEADAPAHRSLPKTEEPAPKPDPETVWRGRFGEIHQRMRKLQAQLDADQKDLDQTSVMVPGSDSTPNPEYARLKTQIRDERIALDETKKELDALDHEASQQAVPREWRR